LYRDFIFTISLRVEWNFKNGGYKMSLEAVIEYFSEFNMDHRVMVLENSTATTEELEKSDCPEC
jgi:hypothetical protein